jgi:hypothetical protein
MPMCNLLQYHFVMVDRFISTAAASLAFGDPCIWGWGGSLLMIFPFGQALEGKISSPTRFYVLTFNVKTI